MGENKKFNKRLINCNRNMRNKKVVRLTESQLHNIIAESVSQILTEMVDEGQGWDLFKSVRNDYKNRPQSYRLNDPEQKAYEKSDEYKQAKKNFINHGNAEHTDYNLYGDYDPANSGHYAKDKESMDFWTKDCSQGDTKYKPINRGLMGKLGRRAGLAASNAYLKYQGWKQRNQ